jgi:hypothetical protein
MTESVQHGLKRCAKCRQFLPEAAFWRDRSNSDGLVSRCRDCKRAARTPEGNRKYYARHREAERARHRARHRRDKAGKKRPPSADPFKKRARKKLKYAVASGKIQKPSTCSQCGSTTERIDGHHTDYSKPLDVQWLCTICHGLTYRRPVPGRVGVGKELLR